MIGGERSRQAVNQVIFQHQELIGGMKYVRLVASQPKDFRRRPGGHNILLAAYLINQLAAEFPADYFGLFFGPVVQPNDGLAQRPAVAVQHNQGFALTGYPERGDALRRNLGFLQNVAQWPPARQTSRLPASSSTMSGAGIIQMIFMHAAAQQLAREVEQRSFQRRGARVQCQNEIHFAVNSKARLSFSRVVSTSSLPPSEPTWPLMIKPP